MESGNYNEDQSSLLSEKVSIERKHFFFDLKENVRGRFLRITEDVRGRRDTIIVPSTGLLEFKEALDRVIELDEEMEPAESFED